MIILLKYEYPFSLNAIISLQFYNKPFAVSYTHLTLPTNREV